MSVLEGGASLYVLEDAYLTPNLGFEGHGSWKKIDRYSLQQDITNSVIAFVVPLGGLPAAKSIKGPSWASLAICSLTFPLLFRFSISPSCCMWSLKTSSYPPVTRIPSTASRPPHQLSWTSRAIPQPFPLEISSCQGVFFTRRTPHSSTTFRLRTSALNHLL